MIAVTEQHSFGETGDTWLRMGVRGSDRCMRLAQRRNPDTDESGQGWWHVRIDNEREEIRCSVVGYRRPERAVSYRFPLRAGTILLDKLDEKSAETARAWFREAEFQEFLDKYGIFAVWNYKLNGREFQGVDWTNEETGERTRTTCMYGDGVISYDKEDDTYCGFRGVTWVLERRVVFDAHGRPIKYGWILYTGKRWDPERLRKSFSEHGISPIE